MTSETQRRLEHEAEGSAAGALAGAVIGAVAGPPGALAGALIGVVAGALAGFAVDKDLARIQAYDAALDVDIGVSTGEMGAPNLRHPRPQFGAYSDASAGAPGVGDEEPAEGPMQPPPSA